MASLNRISEICPQGASIDNFHLPNSISFDSQFLKIAMPAIIYYTPDKTGSQAHPCSLRQANGRTRYCRQPLQTLQQGLS